MSEVLAFHHPNSLDSKMAEEIKPLLLEKTEIPQRSLSILVILLSLDGDR